MINAGLTSITFRQLPPAKIISLAVKAGLEGIEWGGDVHVPPGDLENACRVRAATESAGLRVASYGSYFRCDEPSGDYTSVLNTGQALGAPLIRVWPGSCGSTEASPDYRKEVAHILRSLVEKAAERGMKIGLEYHADTLTDTAESAHQLLKEVGKDELKLYWQPRTENSHAKDLRELKSTLPVLSNIHVFHWLIDSIGLIDRRPLHEGSESWSQYFKHAHDFGGNYWALLEFVREDNESNFLRDAAKLKQLIPNS